MPLEGVVKILETIRRPIHFLQWIALAAGLFAATVLFGPASLTQTLVGSQWLHDYGQWLGVILLAAICIDVVAVIAAIVEGASRRRREREELRRRIDQERRRRVVVRLNERQEKRGLDAKRVALISGLIDTDKTLLRDFFVAQDHIVVVPSPRIDYATRLAAAGIIRRLRPNRDPHGNWCGEVYTLERWAMDLLHANPDLVAPKASGLKVFGKPK